MTERALLEHYAQAGVLVNSRGQILHIVGRTGRFLEPADGDAAMNILDDGARRPAARVDRGPPQGSAQKEPVAYDRPADHRWKASLIRAKVAVRPVDTDTDTYLVVLEQMPQRHRRRRHVSRPKTS